MSDSFSFEDFLAQQRAGYRASLPGRLDQLQAAWAQALSADDTPAGLQALERCAHGLAGSAATFGLAGLGDAARRLEEAVAPEAPAAPPAGPDGAAVLRPLVEELAALLRQSA